MSALLRLLALLLAAAPALSAAEHDHAAPAAASAPVYRCPMHPWIKTDRPAKCTICGMDLVASTSAPSAAAGTDLATVALGPSVVTTIGVQTATVAAQPLSRTLRVPGRIEDDDTRHRLISARVPGRIEKLFLTFVGAPVEAGTPLATLWSPELLTAQRVYVERLRGGDLAFSVSERAAAREQLQQLGLTETDIARLETTREPSATVTLRAPLTGTVVAKSVYEGQYVQPSDRLFEIADFSRMWFVFDAYAQDLPWLQVGQTVEVTTRAVPGETIVSTVEFIDPNFDEAKQTSRVRAVLPNPHYSIGGVAHLLPHRVLAEGRVLIETPAVLAAPRSAILDSGRGPLAYVDLGDGRYEQRAVTLGRRGDTLVEILSGLRAGENVVTTAALLIDAQAQLTAEAHTVASPQPAASAQTPFSDRSAPHSLDFAVLAAAAVDAADALANDDVARYHKLLPALTAASTGLMLPALEPGTSLKSARLSFEPWSTAVADLLAPHRAHLGLKVYQCPMTPVLGRGRWVQRAAPLKNPFFGSTMLECGDEVR